MRLHIRSSHHISTFLSYPCPFRLTPLHSRHVHLSFQVRRPHLSLIVALSGRVHLRRTLLLTHLYRSPRFISFPRPDSTSTPPLRFTACAPIFTPHTPSYHAHSVSLHALAISPLALISRALCLLNKTLPPSLPSCLRAFRPSTLVVTSTRNPAGARAFTCAPQASHPSSDSFISVLTPSHTPSGHRLSGHVTSDLRHQTHACANFRVESCAPFGTHYIPALSW